LILVGVRFSPPAVLTSVRYLLQGRLRPTFILPDKGYVALSH
jgi:hypothetical protein